MRHGAGFSGNGVTLQQMRDGRDAYFVPPLAASQRNFSRMLRISKALRVWRIRAVPRMKGPPVVRFDELPFLRGQSHLEGIIFDILDGPSNILR
jgi:hypothetical protein